MNKIHVPVVQYIDTVSLTTYNNADGRPPVKSILSCRRNEELL